MPEPTPVALVTGSTSGIGAAVARRLSADGMAVVLNSRTSVERGRELASQLPRARYVQADVADDAEARRLVAEAVDWLGRLDVLVNNAGSTVVIPHDDLEAASPPVWRRLYDVNVIGPWVVTTAAVPALRAAGGCVVNVSSRSGVQPAGSSIPYAASKAALNHVTRLLAATLGPEIRVNAVAPGLVETPWTADWHEARERWRQRAPLGRAGLPEDVAEVVAGLVAATFVTGQVVVVDGGMSLR